MGNTFNPQSDEAAAASGGEAPRIDAADSQPVPPNATPLASRVETSGGSGTAPPGSDVGAESPAAPVPGVASNVEASHSDGPAPNAASASDAESGDDDASMSSDTDDGAGGDIAADDSDSDSSVGSERPPATTAGGNGAPGAPLAAPRTKHELDVRARGACACCCCGSPFSPHRRAL